MLEKLENVLLDRGATILCTADLSVLPKEQSKEYQSALVIGATQPLSYLRELSEKGESEGYANEEYLERVKLVDSLADYAADYLLYNGFISCSLSQKNMELLALVGSDQVPKLPNDVIAAIAGVGWVGKNNKLVTKEYGCGLCICCVLTNAPLRPPSAEPVTQSQCGNCRVCKTVCSQKAIVGNNWSLGMDPAELVNSELCNNCHVCMARCLLTQGYVRKNIRGIA